MDRSDLTQAALEALHSRPLSSSNAMNPAEAHRVRAKILGVLIRLHRLDAERSLAECAEFMRTESREIQAWEHGDQVPSWPQVEMLAHFLRWDESKAVGLSPTMDEAVQKEYLLLRQRLVGGMLRAARESVGLSTQDLGAMTGYETERLDGFELGQEEIPVNCLIALAQALDKDLSYFALEPKLALDSPAAADMVETPGERDSELRQFSQDLENRAFIRLAMAFQNIERADLHRIADALWAIIGAEEESNGWSGAPA